MGTLVSSDVASGDLATAAGHYNTLRSDMRTNHDHDGTAGVATIAATTFNGNASWTTNSLSFSDTIDLFFGTGDDAGLRWSTADASNHAFVLFLDNTSQSLHITDKAAVGTDWAVSSTTHPNVYIHSNTTPATDYLRIGGHDGTNADIDVVGGTTLQLQIGGTNEATLTASDFNLQNNTLSNIGSASNDWTATVLTHSGSATQTLKVITSDNNENAIVQVETSASGGSGAGAQVRFVQGDGLGSANNMSYRLGYDNGNGRFFLRSLDMDGSSTDGDIFRVNDGQTSIDADTTWDDNVYDAYDDAAMLSPYRDGQLNLADRREQLISIGIFKRYDDGWVGYNDQRMAAFLAGGIYQNRWRMDRQHEVAIRLITSTVTNIDRKLQTHGNRLSILEQMEQVAQDKWCEMQAELHELKAEIQELKGALL